MRREIVGPARAELEEAFDFYEGRRPGLGDELIADFEAAVAKILRNPTMGRRVARDVRRWSLHQFPYALIYQVRQDLLLIVAVAHFRRKPNYWRNRLAPGKKP
jgi:plasmid stabilization system protein ParE